MSIGTGGRTLAGVQEVFRLPLYKSASHLVLIHNHPSGNLKPSESDIDTTNRLIQVGIIMNCEVHDHVIVTPNSFYSFKENGLIEKLRWDRKYALTFVRDKQVAEEIEKIKRNADRFSKKEGIKEGEEKGARKQKQEIAKNLLNQDVDIEIVKKATGLSSQWVGRLKREIEKSKQ